MTVRSDPYQTMLVSTIVATVLLTAEAGLRSSHGTNLDLTALRDTHRRQLDPCQDDDDLLVNLTWMMSLTEHCKPIGVGSGSIAHGDDLRADWIEQIQNGASKLLSELGTPHGKLVYSEGSGLQVVQSID